MVVSSSSRNVLVSVAIVMIVLVVGLALWNIINSQPRPTANETKGRAEETQQLVRVFRGHITALTVDKMCTVDEFTTKYPEAVFNGSHVMHRDVVYPVTEVRLENGSIVRYVPVFCKSETQYYFIDIDKRQQYVLDLTKATLRLKEPLHNIVGTKHLVFVNGTLKNGVLYALAVYD